MNQFYRGILTQYVEIIMTTYGLCHVVERHTMHHMQDTQLMYPVQA